MRRWIYSVLTWIKGLILEQRNNYYKNEGQLSVSNFVNITYKWKCKRSLIFSLLCSLAGGSFLLIPPFRKGCYCYNLV